MSLSMFFVHFFSLFLIWSNIMALTKTECGPPLYCCPNYYLVDGICQKCPNGTFGRNCLSTCPENFYGEFCVQECNCKKHESCNPIHGCKVKLGDCGEIGSKVRCCENYVEQDGKCKACAPGTWGKNCSDTCPDGFFGLFCENRCPCKKCNKVIGCGDNGVCGINGNEVRCCSNYMLSNGTCQACAPGTYGEDCSYECPRGFYGVFCTEKCSCEENCDKVVGCAEPDDQHKLWTQWILICILGILLFACIVWNFIRLKRKKNIPRKYVDIPHLYSHTWDFYGYTDNTVSDNLNAAGRRSVDANSNRKTTKVTNSLVQGSSDEEHETGTYDRLTLRINYHEEPIRHKPLAKSYSDTSSMLIRLSEIPANKRIHSPSKVKRSSSLRIIKSTTELENDIRIDTPSENCIKDASRLIGDHTQSLVSCHNVYDLASKEDKNYRCEALQEDFLQELTTQLMNVKKY
ncbi:uncharacterized protein LOC111133886 isoform X2 [Crassostrea virginica]